MKNKRIWWIMLVIGVFPFVIPFLGFAYEMINSSSWSLFDYWVLYSFLYWPTYIIGIIMIIISVYKLNKF